MDVPLCKTNCGHKKKEINMNQVVREPLRNIGTIRSTAQANRVPKSTLFNYIQYGNIWQHSNAIKLHLTLANVVKKEEFCKYFIKVDKSTFGNT